LLRIVLLEGLKPDRDVIADPGSYPPMGWV
jgi:hypothetical protein